MSSVSLVSFPYSVSMSRMMVFALSEISSILLMFAHILGVGPRVASLLLLGGSQGCVDCP